MNHAMRVCERMIEHRLRRETRVFENQFRFIPGRSTTRAIFLLQ